MMHFGGFGDMGYGLFGFGWIFMALFWGLVIAGLVYVLRLLLGSGKAASNAARYETAGDVLKKRYAAGEITKEEYLERKRVIIDREEVQ